MQNQRALIIFCELVEFLESHSRKPASCLVKIFRLDDQFKRKTSHTSFRVNFLIQNSAKDNYLDVWL